MDQEQQQQQPITHREILEKGMIVFRKILNQPVLVTREEMCDILNFEVSVTTLISNMKATEGKTPDELLELAKKSLSPAVTQD